MADYVPSAVHQAAVSAWRNMTGFGQINYGPDLTEALTAEELAKQTARTPRLLGDAGNPTLTRARPAPNLRNKISVPLSKQIAGAGFSIATSGPYSGPLMVEMIAVSTNIERTNPSDGLLVVAAQSDFGQAVHTDALNGTINLLGGIRDAVGTQFYAPGPTGQTAYVLLNRIIDWPAVYFRASGQNGAAGTVDYGVLIQIASIYADDPSLSWLPEFTPEVIYQRTARAAPLPKPRQPAYPRAVQVAVSAGPYGAATRIVPFSALDPALAALAIDPLTGAWVGAKNLTAIW